MLITDKSKKLYLSLNKLVIPKELVKAVSEIEKELPEETQKLIKDWLQIVNSLEKNAYTYFKINKIIDISSGSAYKLYYPYRFVVGKKELPYTEDQLMENNQKFLKLVKITKEVLKRAKKAVKNVPDKLANDFANIERIKKELEILNGKDVLKYREKRQQYHNALQNLPKTINKYDFLRYYNFSYTPPQKEALEIINSNSDQWMIEEKSVKKDIYQNKSYAILLSYDDKINYFCYGAWGGGELAKAALFPTEMEAEKFVTKKLKREKYAIVEVNLQAGKIAKSSQLDSGKLEAFITNTEIEEMFEEKKKKEMENKLKEIGWEKTEKHNKLKI